MFVLRKRARHGRSGAAIAMGVLALASSAVLTAPTAARAADPAGVLIPAPDAYADRADTLLSTSNNGVLHQEEGAAGYLWTNTYNRRTVPVTALDGVPREAVFTQHDEYDRAAYATTVDGTTTITLVNVEQNTTTRLTLPQGYTHPQVSVGFVLATRETADGGHELRALRPSGSGTPYDVAVRLPSGATAEAEPVVYGGESTSLVIRYRLGSSYGYGTLNGISGAVAALPVTGDATGFRITREVITWFTRQGGQGVRVLARATPNAAPKVLPLSLKSADSEVTPYVVGRNVLWTEGRGGALNLTPIDGAETPRVLLTEFEQGLERSDSMLTALGRTSDGTRAIHLFTVDGSGLVFDLPLRELKPVKKADGSVRALGLDRGTVRFADALPGSVRLHGKDVGTGLDPVAGADLPVFDAAAPGRFADGADQGLARLVADPDSGNDVLLTGDDPAAPAHRLPLPAAGGRIVDASPSHVLYRTPGADGRNYVVDTARDTIVQDQPASAASLDHSTLWTAQPDGSGTLIATDLRTGRQSGAVALRAGCVPDDLQTNGRLIYWSCTGQDRAGVYDATADVAYPAPAHDVLLGDGFLAQRVTGDDGVRLTGLNEDGTTADLGSVSGVKDSAGDGRGVTWAVDRHAGKIAFVDRDDTVHVTAVRRTLSPLALADSSVPGAFRPGGAAWDARWWLSKPAASWKLTLRSRDTGAVVRTWTGSATRGTVPVSWDGTATDGTTASVGGYTWALTAAPADGQGPSLRASGTLDVTGS
ncbi:FlgD immunoglobulin-like domain containing protein [Streptomyces sp. cg36]|uniref:FlgD immunoglobulin-like domain containing protein n=1 Tax=Streptomyces sp. cg36 TaxID=3238798 RepID=UPI0034E26C56